MRPTLGLGGTATGGSSSKEGSAMSRWGGSRMSLCFLFSSEWSSGGGEGGGRGGGECGGRRGDGGGGE